MSNRIDPVRVSIWEEESFVVFARMVSLAGLYVTQASLSSITCKVYDCSSVGANALVASPTVTIASAIYDTLQTADDRWTRDTTGYNFTFVVPGTAFLEPDRMYRVEFIFTATSGHISALVVEAFTSDLLGR